MAELISMPRNVIAVTRPSTFSGATGSSGGLYKVIAMLTFLAQFVGLTRPHPARYLRPQSHLFPHNWSQSERKQTLGVGDTMSKFLII